VGCIFSFFGYWSCKHLGWGGGGTRFVFGSTYDLKWRKKAVKRAMLVCIIDEKMKTKFD